MFAKASVNGTVICWLVNIGFGGELQKNKNKGVKCNYLTTLAGGSDNDLWGKDKAGGCSGATFLPLLLTCTALTCLVWPRPTLINPNARVGGSVSLPLNCWHWSAFTNLPNPSIQILILANPFQPCRWVWCWVQAWQGQLGRGWLSLVASQPTGLHQPSTLAGLIPDHGHGHDSRIKWLWCWTNISLSLTCYINFLWGRQHFVPGIHSSLRHLVQPV